MAIEIKMPAFSPTMDEGTLVKWLVKVGDHVLSGDILAEIETDKATIELVADDEGVIAAISVPDGTDRVKVGTIIATLATKVDRVPSAAEATDTREVASDEAASQPSKQSEKPANEFGLRHDPEPHSATPLPVPSAGEQANASPLTRRLAAEWELDLTMLIGSGSNGRIVRADLLAAYPGAEWKSGATQCDGRRKPSQDTETAAVVPAATLAVIPDIPHEAATLSDVHKTIARRVTTSKQTVPHIYLTVDVQLDALLRLRTELNASSERRGVKLSITDLLVKALALALVATPKCNVMFTPDQLITFKRADISVAVSTLTGIVMPVVTGADTKSVSHIATEIKELSAVAREGGLDPEHPQGGTASISNMGVWGIKQFEAVINPQQGMILALGAGEKRPWVLPGGNLGVATVMSVTGSFDHRCIDGADGAALMQAFRELISAPMDIVA